MLIKSAHIQHYRSLSDIRLEDLGSLTLLVGSNAVGKSNIVDAFRFMRDMVVDGLDHAISSRGGIEVIRQYSPTRPFNVGIRIEFEQNFESFGVRNSFYEIKIASLEGGNYRVEKEDAQWYEEEGRFVKPGTEQEQWVQDDVSITYLSRDSKGKVNLKGEEPLARPWREDETVLRAPVFDYTNPVSSLLSGQRFSALYPNTLRSPSRPDTDKRLKESGENWASVLKSLRATPRGRQAWQSILELMQRVIPNLQDVKVSGVGGYLVPQFVFRDSPNRKEHSFDPVQLSDGTLRIFGLLLGLYQVPPPRLFAIEEPEQTVHPGVLAVLADAFREVSKRTQLLITTHSPYLVDHFDPEQVRIVTMSAGETRVGRISPTQVESVKEHLVTLQELIAQDNLQLEESE